MSQDSYQFEDLVAIEDIIRSVARSSLEVYYHHSTASYKTDGSIVTDADLAMQNALTEALLKRFPGVRMLGEEISEQQQNAVFDSGEDFWCLDPVDGTTNFHATLPMFSVSLALFSQGEIRLGVVYDPNRDECFSAIKGQGFWVNREKLERPDQPGQLQQAIAFVDFKRLPTPLCVSLVEDMPYKSQRNIGTCALEWAWLATGRVNLLLHGHEKIWDYGAGVLLNQEAGGVSETFTAEAVFNHVLTPRSVIGASNPQLFELWAARVRAAL